MGTRRPVHEGGASVPEQYAVADLIHQTKLSCSKWVVRYVPYMRMGALPERFKNCLRQAHETPFQSSSHNVERPSLRMHLDLTIHGESPAASFDGK